jgi:hypothetical protein
MKKQITLGALFFLGVVILGLLLSNPSNKSYTDYLKSKGYKLESYKVQIHSPDAGYLSDEYECKPFWGKMNSFLILSSCEYQVDSVFIQPERRIDKAMTINEREELKEYNAQHGPRYYHITKNHIGILSKFYETKSTVDEFKVN